MTDQVQAQAVVNTGANVTARLGLTQTFNVTAETLQDALNQLAQQVDSNLLVVKRDEDGEYVAPNGDVILLRPGQSPRPVVNINEPLQDGDRFYLQERRSNG